MILRKFSSGGLYGQSFVGFSKMQIDVLLNGRWHLCLENYFLRDWEHAFPSYKHKNIIMAFSTELQI